MKRPAGSKPLKQGLEILFLAATLAAAVPTGKFLASCYRDYQTRPVAGEFSRLFTGRLHSLSIYGTASCPACRKAREYLVKEGVPFNDLRIDDDETLRAEWRSLGKDSYPILLTPNKLRLGFEHDRMREMITELRSENP